MSNEHIKKLQSGLTGYLNTLVKAGGVDKEHVAETPARFVKSLSEIFEGVNKDPRNALNTLFTAKAHDMIHSKDISYFSTCAHHLVPFYGTMSFAYIPDKHIVGLSKIPRLVEVFARRPQVQEQLTNDIVNAFQDIVQPKGCALMVKGKHMCMMIRGIKQTTSYTETTALRGIFENIEVKSEWLASCNAPEWNR